jgi:hypothetical protein
MKEETQFDVPFQVQTLITNLNDKKERVHVRGNYRMRLESIKRACEKAISDYDVEMGTIQSPRYKRGQR